MIDCEADIQITKRNRRMREERNRQRPVVHGALPYFGHRPRAKDELRRVAEFVDKARNRHR